MTQLKTPAFVIDIQRLRRNIASMSRRAAELGIALRPHVKTHKTLEIAELQNGDRRGGITVSTLAEAWFYQRAGFRDITYAFPITADKLTESVELTCSLDRFYLIVDQEAAIAALEERGGTAGLRFQVLIEVDVGHHRSGVDPRADASLEFAGRIQDAAHIELGGVLTHGGQAYHCSNAVEIAEAAATEREVLVRFAAKLRDRGIPCPVVSAGSTPTAVHGRSGEGLTEIRPGNYVFYDKFQADIGTCRLDDCAATILTTVVGHYRDHNQILVDAGALALSKDRGAEHVVPELTFGSVIGCPHIRVASLSQEHGLLTSSMKLPFERLPVGSRIRIVPNHSCLAAALFPRYHVINRDEVVDEWRPVRGW